MDWQREEKKKTRIVTKCQTEILKAGASFYAHLQYI